MHIRKLAAERQSDKRPIALCLKPVLTVALALMGTLATSQAVGQLRVDLSSQSREWGSATLQQAKEGLYGVRNRKEKENVRAVRCSEGGKLSAVNGQVEVRKGCGDLTWEFGLARYPVEGMVASRQSSLFSKAPTWWMLSEEDAILNASGASSEISFFLDGQPADIQAGSPLLPGLHQAPGFWLLGTPVYVDRGNVRHFFDRRQAPRHLLELLDDHAACIGYLLDKLPPALLPPVFWMGLADWRLTVGGAAGTGLVLANYPVHAEDFDRTAHAITLYVVLHEHSHLLFEGRGSLWISESLASFLAIKAVEDTAPELYPALANAFIEPGKALDTPLPVLGERAAADDGQAYMQLYVGAAFWKVIDTAMKELGHSEGLLRVVPELLARGFASGGAPRPDAIAQVTSLPPETLDPIFDRYLGIR